MTRIAAPGRARWAALWCLLLTLCGCAGFCGDALAEVSEVQGQVEREVASRPGIFVTAALGDDLRMGDALRTGSNSRAHLALVPSGKVLVEEQTLLRFMSERPEDGTDVLTIEDGVVELSSEGLEIELRTRHASLTIPPRSHVRIVADGDRLERLDVLVGRARIVREDSPDANEILVVGQHVLYQQAAAPAVAPVPSREPERPAARSGPETAPPAEPKGSAELELPRLEDATLHVTKLPIRIAIKTQPCSSARAVIAELARPSSALGGVLSLGPGTHSLVERCGDKVSARARLRLVRDSGMPKRPRSVPSVAVAADGRNYTVRYQNQLPAFTVTWPEATPSRAYTLHLIRGPKERTFTQASPRWELGSGQIGEGETSYRITTAEGRGSRTSRVRVVSDNLARSAYLSSPAEGSASAPVLNVAGAALSRSEVSVDGRVLPLDEQGRFSASLPQTAQRRAIAVRMSHPSTGVHYYVRRLSVH